MISFKDLKEARKKPLLNRRKTICYTEDQMSEIKAACEEFSEATVAEAMRRGSMYGLERLKQELRESRKS